MIIPVEPPIDIPSERLTSIASHVLKAVTPFHSAIPIIEPMGQSGIGTTTQGIFRVAGQVRV